MAKLIKSYKGFKIKVTTTRDNTSYSHWIIDTNYSSIEPIWECDSVEEAIDFINCY
jgi:hypothetical protein